MPSTIYTLTVDCQDHERVAAFWQDALQYEQTFVDREEIAIEPPEDGSGPAILFLRVPDAKVVKNRWHLDLNPHDQASEVARLKSLGAREVDIGQKDVSWVVMADPEENEFCVLTPR
ncbi:MAG: VOC family protein [Actinomycetota bacterium]